jgi:hypothetical protein
VLNSTPTVLGGPIIAGDGYFYIAYQYQNETYVSQSAVVCFTSYSATSTTNTAEHLMLLRVGTDGSSSKIDVKDWQSSNMNVNGESVTTGAFPDLTAAKIITNTDAGTVLTWEAGTVAAVTYGFATTVDTGVAYFGSTAAPVFPVLQAQDGTVYGTDNTYSKMIHFDQYGNTIWSVPNDYPQIATADGGVIGSSGITYDSQGRAEGQIANLPTKGWLGDSYQTGANSIQSVEPVPVDPASSLGAFLSGNPSGNNTAAQDVFRLGVPTSVKHTFNGTPLSKCLNYPLGPYVTYTFYGYEECRYYPLLDHGTPPQPITRSGIRFDEAFGPPTIGGNFTVNQFTGYGYTLVDPIGLLLDNLYWGFPANPIPAGYYYLQQQTITLHNSRATVRVNCLDFEATDVSVTDVTNTPGTPCTRQ